jgi:phage terminase small subunit
MHAGLDAGKILAEVAKLAHSDIAGIMATDGKVKLPHELDAVTRAAVASFKIDEYGRIEYKFWDKNTALEKAMKHLGLYEKDNAQKPAALVGEVRLVALQPEKPTTGD